MIFAVTYWYRAHYLYMTLWPLSGVQRVVSIVVQVPGGLGQTFCKVQGYKDPGVINP